jgi:hypothetical protein
MYTTYFRVDEDPDEAFMREEAFRPTAFIFYLP